MARTQAQYLRVFDEDATYYRWQNHYPGETVSYDSQSWEYQGFEADAFTDGQTGDEGGVPLTLTGTAFVVNVISEAIRRALLVEVSIYEFDDVFGSDAPQSDQALIASCIGEVVGGSRTSEEVSVELGSSLAPVGSQVPPRKFTSRLVGVPCKL